MYASAGNRARVTSMATMYATTRPLILLEWGEHRLEFAIGQDVSLHALLLFLRNLSLLRFVVCLLAPFMVLLILPLLSS